MYCGWSFVYCLSSHRHDSLIPFSLQLPSNRQVRNAPSEIRVNALILIHLFLFVFCRADMEACSNLNVWRCTLLWKSSAAAPDRQQWLSSCHAKICDMAEEMIHHDLFSDSYVWINRVKRFSDAWWTFRDGFVFNVYSWSHHALFVHCQAWASEIRRCWNRIDTFHPHGHHLRSRRIAHLPPRVSCVSSQRCCGIQKTHQPVWFGKVQTWGCTHFVYVSGTSYNCCSSPTDWFWRLQNEGKTKKSTTECRLVSQ